MAPPAKLELLSKTSFDFRLPAGFPVCCPTLDLTASWHAESKDLYVYRSPNQVVSKLHQIGAPGQKAPEALKVAWKPDGQFYAVAWSDGRVRLMGLENSKAAHNITVSEQPDVSIIHLGWAQNQLEKKRSKPLSEKSKLAFDLSELSLGDHGPKADLPLEVMYLEVETSLPKISPLPSSSAGSGDDAALFTSRLGIEFLFPEMKPEDYHQATVLIVGLSDGKLHLSIYDSLVIGTLQGPLSTPSNKSLLIHHTSNPPVTTHLLLFGNKVTEPDRIHLVPMDFPFLFSSPANLSLISSRLTTLQKLLRYLKQTSLHMQAEWKNLIELPSRFLRSIKEDLSSVATGPNTIEAALLHLVATGHAPKPLQEWLTEVVAERGHKRWDKAVTSALENLRALVHEHFAPVLDRCSIAVSRLRGLVLFHDGRDDLSMNKSDLNKILEVISCLRLMGRKVLMMIMEELDLFQVFSGWMRLQIDQLDASDALAEELSEKEATMNYGKVLRYIQRFLDRRPLGAFFGGIPPDDHTSDWNHIEDGPDLMELLDAQLKNVDTGKPHMNALLHLDFLIDYLAARSQRLFDGVSLAQKRSVRFGRPMELSIGEVINKFDSRICPDQKGGAIGYAAIASKVDSETVHLFRAAIQIVNGISSNGVLERCLIRLGKRKLVDLKFLDGQSLLLLCADEDKSNVILRFPMTASQLQYHAASDEESHQINSLDAASVTTYSIPAVSGSRRAVQMEVFERSDVREEIPARICVLDETRSAITTFAVSTS